MTLCLTQLYCDECVIHDCLSNSSLLAWFKAIDEGTCPKPVHVDLSNNYLGDKNVAAVCVVLSVLTQIESINFSKMDLQANGVQAICNLAEKHPKIKRLDLRGNQLFASSGRAILTLVKRNPNITQCLVDEGEIPHRFYDGIVTQIGKNISRRYPCTWTSVKKEESAIVDLGPCVATRVVAAQTPFQRTLLDELDQCTSGFLECYRLCGEFACQFFVDFGPVALTEFLLPRAKAHFLDRSRDQCLSTSPVASLVKHVLDLELQAVCSSDAVREAVEGTLLEEQLDAARKLVDLLEPHSDTKAAVAMVSHIRNSLSYLPSPRFAHVAETAATLRQTLVSEITTSRNLTLLYQELRYFQMDYPEMERDVLDCYKSCQTPLRISKDVLADEILRLGRAPFAAKRRDLLTRFWSSCPEPLKDSIFSSLVVLSLDTSANIEDLHKGAMTSVPSYEWIRVATEYLASEHQARQLVLAWTAWETYRCYSS